MWTFDDIPSQEGRTAIVTGANSGLGYQIALMLARRSTFRISIRSGHSPGRCTKGMRASTF